MNPAELTKRATDAGVQLALLTSGGIFTMGEPSAIGFWFPAIRQREVISADIQRESCHAKMLVIVWDDLCMHYATDVVCIKTDPVNVFIGIHNVTSFDPDILRTYYNPFALVDAVEKQTGD